MSYLAIDYATKVEDGGTTANGLVSAADLNQIKDKSNSNDSNFDVRIDSLEVAAATTLPSYQDEAAAVVAGLATGKLYQTSGTGSGALFAEVGVVMVKQ
tara:strand:+ start:332 stop:628 length:297 start_codon:yes stop_codon:yes gene_type:complete